MSKKGRLSLSQPGVLRKGFLQMKYYGCITEMLIRRIQLRVEKTKGLPDPEGFRDGILPGLVGLSDRNIDDGIALVAEDLAVTASGAQLC